MIFLIGSQPNFLPQWDLQWISRSSWCEWVCSVSWGEVLLLRAGSRATYYQACKSKWIKCICFIVNLSTRLFFNIEHFKFLYKWLYSIHIITLCDMMFQTGVCPDGHYCPLGTGYPYSYPCKAGQYRKNMLGHSGEACVLCPSSYYCSTPGAHMSSVCPQVLWKYPAFWEMFYDKVLRLCSWACRCICKMVTSLFLSLHPAFSVSYFIHRAFIVQRALLLQNLALKERTAPALPSLMGLSAPLVVQASIALVWDSQSPLETAKRASTAEREPSLQYENAILIMYFIQLFSH